MVYSALNMGQVKKRNRSMILKCINESGPVSRKDIAELTGLTPASVTQICNQLMEQGLLAERGTCPESKGAGRRKVLLALNYDYAYVLSVTMEAEETVVALCNMAGELLDQKKRATEGDIPPEVFLQKIAEDCREIENCHPREAYRLLGVSLGITGLVDRERGVSMHAYGIWEQEVEAGRILAGMLGHKVLVENNVNAFATAELLFGLGKIYDNLVIIKWGPGVGSTIVIDQAVYDGRHGKAAEIGHVIVEKDGKKCSCGRRGCLETVVSHQALCQIHPFDAEDFGDVYADAKAKEREKFDAAIDLFGRSIVNMVTTLAPNRVVLTGSMFRSPLVRKAFIDSCGRYDSRCDENRILYTDLAGKERYIGPVAVFVQREIF